jgi:hypothetical protein
MIEGNQRVILANSVIQNTRNPRSIRQGLRILQPQLTKLTHV